MTPLPTRPILLLVLVCSLSAEDRDEVSFSLRFPAALSRFAGAASISGYAGASAGSRWSSSMNPAVLDWEKAQTPFEASASGHFNRLDFENGMDLNAAVISGTIDTHKAGVLSPTFAQVSSNRVPNRQGIDYEVSMDLEQLSWGKQVSETFAVGLGLSYSESEVTLRTMDLPLMESTSESYGLRLGAAYAYNKDLLLGLAVDYSSAPSKTMTFVPFTFSGNDELQKDTATQYLVRPGLSYTYWKDSAFYADYQFGFFHDDTGSHREHRLYAGIDQELIPGLYGRIGSVVDATGAVGYSTGLGLYPCKYFSMSIAYQRNMMPEIEREFGRCQIYVLSVSVSF